MHLIKAAKNWRKKYKHPRGAITFSELELRRNFSHSAKKEAHKVMQMFGFSKLLLVHGSANLVNGKISIISGPPGIGKSSASRRASRKGNKQVEEGMLVLGRRGNKLFLVETGTMGYKSSAARASNLVRRAMFLRKKDWDPKLTPKERPVRFKALQLNALFTQIDLDVFEPKLHQVGKICVAEHESDPHTPLLINSKLNLSDISDLRTVLPREINLTRFTPGGSRAKLEKRLERELLSVSE